MLSWESVDLVLRLEALTDVGDPAGRSSCADGGCDMLQMGGFLMQCLLCPPKQLVQTRIDTKAAVRQIHQIFYW